MTDQDKQAKIDAIKARLAKGKSGGDAAPADSAPAAPAGGDNPAPPPGDKAAMLAAIKKRLAGGAPVGGGPGGGGAPAAASGAAAADAGGDSGGDDVQARIAALKAKMEAGKGTEKSAAGKPVAKKKKPAGGNVYPVQPINKTIYGDERLYGENTLNRWFVVGGLLLTIAVVLMWRRDAVRQWKPPQEAHRLNQIERLNAERDRADAAIDVDTLGDLDANLASTNTSIEARADELEELQAEVLRRDGTYYAANNRFKIAKSELDALLWGYEEERILHGDDKVLMAEADERLEAQTAKVDELRNKADATNVELLEAKDAVKALLAEQVELTRLRDALVESRTKAERSLAKIDHGLFNDYIRNAPVADMLAPTLQVKKVVLDKLKDNYNFQYVGKVDMCQTCHVSIDDPYYSNWDDLNEKGGDGPLAGKGERVLNAHPKLDLFVGDSSAHPMGEFGCTTCHQGRGQAVEFERTFHTPAPTVIAGAVVETAEEKEARWIDDWNYDPARHYWDWPMTPSDKLYSSCFQCHDSTDRLAGAPEYNESRELVEDLGCYGCHKIEGFTHLRKPGPDLTNLAVKTTPDWIAKWLMDPQGFRPTTRMPHFWNQSNAGAQAEDTISPDVPWENNSDRWVDDWRFRNEVEARAITAYVVDRSREQLADGSYAMEQTPGGVGDPEAGEATFAERGCLGCHPMEDEGWTENDHGPELSAMGSKTNPRWLYNWIRNPKAYYHTTVMPDLRLTDAEAWNITAWLMGQRDEDFENRAVPRTDDTVLDDIAVSHLSAVAGDGWAREEVARMRAAGGTAEVEVFVGQKLFERNGCAGCHLVPGHYDDVGIGTELTYESLKETTKFDFGHEASHANPDAIGHARRDWYRRKMQDPRAFDRMPVVETGADGEPVVAMYEQKVKRPNDKLKMPNFYLDESESDLVVQFLLGLRADGIDPTMKVALDADQQLVEEGSRLITKYNCIGCHRMGQLSSDLQLALSGDFDDDLEALEELLEDVMDDGAWMAGPVVIDDRQLFSHGDWLSDEFYDEVEEEDYDLLEFFEDDPENRPFPASFHVFGEGEGGMGKYIDESALRPPVLRGQGAKSNPGWLFDFLLAPYTVRSHVNVRMPTFGMSQRESMALVRWFAAQDGQPWPFEVVSDLEKTVDADLYDLGEKVFNEYQCNSCHPAGSVLPDSDPKDWGPDLGMTAERLKTTWVHDWLLDPQLISPGTRMPNFFGEFAEGEYEPQYDDDWKNGDSATQIRALQHYLEHLGKMKSDD